MTARDTSKKNYFVRKQKYFSLILLHNGITKRHVVGRGRVCCRARWWCSGFGTVVGASLSGHTHHQHGSHRTYSTDTRRLGPWSQVDQLLLKGKRGNKQTPQTAPVLAYQCSVLLHWPLLGAGTCQPEKKYRHDSDNCHYLP